MKHAETMKIVPIFNDVNLDTLAQSVGDSINMSKYHHCTFVVNFQTLATDATYIIVYSGATDAALTSALTFRYAYGGATIGSASCDVLSAASTSANLEIDQATYPNHMVIIEVDASVMDLDNNEEWLTFTFNDTDTGSSGNASVYAILTPRYKGDRSLSALV